MRRWFALSLGLALTAGPAQAAPPPDVMLRAMRDELTRSMHGLVLPASPRPYWMAYRLRDTQSLSEQAVFGALTQDQRTHTRRASVEVRVGSVLRDNGAEPGLQFPMPLDDDYQAARHQFWFLSDQAYKRALAAYSGHQAMLRQRAHPPTTADFSAAPAVVHVEPLEPLRVDAAHWRNLVRRLSARFRLYPWVTSSRVGFDCRVVTSYLITSDGTMARFPQQTTVLSVQAEGRAPDGQALNTAFRVYVPASEAGVTTRDLVPRIDAMARRLRLLSQAPTQKRYLGPVLVTGVAAPEFLADLLGPHLSGETVGGGDDSDLGDRLQHRILPEPFQVVDDPTLSAWHGLPLLGSYPVDAQGVPGQRVVLVAGGRLKSLLLGRKPGPEIHRSNGHARTPGSIMFSNLLFETLHGEPVGRLKRRLQDECRRQALPYGLMIVNLEDPELQALSGAGLGLSRYFLTTSPPALVYRVDVATGRETLVRSGPLEDVSLRTLRDIMAVGDDSFAVNYGDETDPGGVPRTVVAPSVLLEELEFKPYLNVAPSLPVLRNPWFTATASSHHAPLR